MNKVNAEMQEHGDMVMLPVSPVAGSLEECASDSREASKGARRGMAIPFFAGARTQPFADDRCTII